MGLVLLLLACFLCLYRVSAGPTSADRIVAVDILGTLIVGISGLLALATERWFFLDVAISWALLSFIGTVALAKYLEGMSLDE